MDFEEFKKKAKIGTCWKLEFSSPSLQDVYMIRISSKPSVTLYEGSPLIYRLHTKLDLRILDINSLRKRNDHNFYIGPSQIFTKLTKQQFNFFWNSAETWNA